MEYHPKKKTPNSLNYSIILEKINNTSNNPYLFLESEEGILTGDESKETILSKIDKKEIKALWLTPKKETKLDETLLLNESALYTIVGIAHIPHYSTVIYKPASKLTLFNISKNKQLDLELFVKLQLLSNSNEYYFNKLSYEIIFNTALKQHHLDPKALSTIHALQCCARYQILNKNSINQSEHPAASMLSSITIADPIENSKVDLDATITE